MNLFKDPPIDESGVKGERVYKGCKISDDPTIEARRAKQRAYYHKRRVKAEEERKYYESIGMTQCFNCNGWYRLNETILCSECREREMNCNRNRKLTLTILKKHAFPLVKKMIIKNESKVTKAIYKRQKRSYDS